MHNPKAIANAFLKLGVAEERPITPMQLLKLVYIAHGWHLGILGKPLINERAEAWKYGPVVPSIYREFKRFGNQKICDLATTTEVRDGKLVNVPFELTNKTISDFIDRIWGIYKEFSGVSLSMMTHRKGSPWFKVWHDEGGKDFHGTDIPNELIKSHYEGLVEERSQSEIQ